MDPRTPVPLLPMMAWHQKQNMQEHLVAIQRIIDGLRGVALLEPELVDEATWAARTGSSHDGMMHGEH